MEDPRTTVLLVEDDVDIRETTALLLRRAGFAVRVAANGVDALARFAESPSDLVLADIGMPDMDGLTMTSLLRRRWSVPVLLLTARDLPEDVVKGLQVGADDYVTKPFDGDVLVARLRALERRGAHETRTTISIGSITVDRTARTVDRDGSPVVVSPTEFRLLEALIDARGAAVTRRQALRAVWGDEEWIDERVVDTNVLRLRAKLGDCTIETVRGYGYRLAPVKPL